MEQVKTQTEELSGLKNDLYVRLESLRRDLVSRQAHMESLAQMKDAELRALRGAQERESKGLDSEIGQLSAQKG